MTDIVSLVLFAGITSFLSTNEIFYDRVKNCSRKLFCKLRGAADAVWLGKINHLYYFMCSTCREIIFYHIFQRKF